MTDLTAIDTNTSFNTDWASPPGDTILDLIEERGWTQQQLADLLGYSTEQASQLIDGKAPLTEGDALQLQNVLGIPIGFWLNRETSYQAHLARLAPTQD
jgi:HTH-type transcriptional regulator / antitoxin HigA